MWSVIVGQCGQTGRRQGRRVLSCSNGAVDIAGHGEGPTRASEGGGGSKGRGVASSNVEGVAECDKGTASADGGQGAGSGKRVASVWNGRDCESAKRGDWGGTWIIDRDIIAGGNGGGAHGNGGGTGVGSGGGVTAGDGGRHWGDLRMGETIGMVQGTQMGELPLAEMVKVMGVILVHGMVEDQFQVVIRQLESEVKNYIKVLYVIGTYLESDIKN
ncbi:hypothetical protein OG21DRAFT_1525046 [Imleria badia]|nr:hypothetical protein OG21DRAFT_1525046 [Imleria badia]